MREGSRFRRRKTLAERLHLTGFRREIHGYSLTRILIFGLILPAIVALCMVVGMVIAFIYSLSLILKFAVLAVSTIIGFIGGTITILKLYDKMLKFARIKGK